MKTGGKRLRMRGSNFGRRRRSRGSSTAKPSPSPPTHESSTSPSSSAPPPPPPLLLSFLPVRRSGSSRIACPKFRSLNAKKKSKTCAEKSRRLNFALTSSLLKTLSLSPSCSSHSFLSLHGFIFLSFAQPCCFTCIRSWLIIFWKQQSILAYEESQVHAYDLQKAAGKDGSSGVWLVVVMMEIHQKNPQFLAFIGQSILFLFPRLVFPAP